MGLSDLGVETVFRTTDGFTATWLRWGSSEPNGYTSRVAGLEDCITLHNDGELFGDFSCSLKTPTSVKVNFSGKMFLPYQNSLFRAVDVPILVTSPMGFKVCVGSLICTSDKGIDINTNPIG